MNIILKIQRFNPETDEKPLYQNYTVTVEPTDRILDALTHIKQFQDGTLSFRKSCAHGVCGSDAMRINGKDRLACPICALKEPQPACAELPESSIPPGAGPLI